MVKLEDGGMTPPAASYADPAHVVNGALLPSPTVLSDRLSFASEIEGRVS
jgi:hypothetical protein